MADDTTRQPDASQTPVAIRFADGDAVMFADGQGDTTLVEVFIAGQYPQGRLDEQAVAEMAEGYDPARYEAPVSLDHKVDGPAFGWVKAAKAVAGRLFTGFRGLVPEFRDAARAFYPRRSIEAYPPDHPSNPTPGKWALKAVSFLGVQAPAVKGLAPLPASFAEAQQHLTFTVQERRPMADQKTDQADVQKFTEELKARDEQIAKLSEQLKASDAAAVKLAEGLKAETRARLLADERAFCDKLAAEGKLAPVAGWPETLVALRELPADQATVTFAEADKAEAKTSLYDFVKAHLAGLKKVVEFGEVAGDDDGEPGKPEALPVPRGATVEGADVAAKARAFQAEQAKAGKAVTFADALIAVSTK